MAKTNIPGITKPKKYPKGKPYLATFSMGSGSSRKRETFAASTLAEAKDWLFSHRLQTASSLLSASQIYNVPDLFRLWYEVVKKPTIQPGTQITYHQTIKYLNKHLNISASKLSHLALQRFFNVLRDEGLSIRTQKKVFAQISAWAADAMEERLWLSNPTSHIAITESTRDLKTNELLQPSDLKALLNYIYNKELTPQDAYLVAIAVQITSGARSGEVIGSLRLGNIDSDGHWTIDASWILSEKKLGPTKTKNVRQVPLPTNTIDLINRWHSIMQNYSISLGDQGMLLMTHKHNQIVAVTQNDIAYHFKQLQTSVLGRSSTATVSPHSLRKSYITMLLAPKSMGGQGYSLPLVKQIVGHSADSSVTQDVYQKALSTEQANLEKSVNSIFGN